jgi:beta-lactamase superfamily II metal-dependent hydrolase
VGQGDAALITTPEGRHILLDAGPSGERVANVLRAEGVDTLDLVIASHAHADHIGGMAMVLAGSVVRAYVDNGIPHTTATYRRTLGAVEREPGLRYLDAAERTIGVGSVSVRILPPARADATQNDNSVGVLIEYGQFRALYTGDSEAGAVGAWLAAGRIPRVTMVKIAHHGSRNGSTAALVRATSPVIALISVGSRNAYGHPSAQVEQAWRAAPATVYRTDRHGTIELAAKADGSFTVRTERDRAGTQG